MEEARIVGTILRHAAGAGRQATALNAAIAAGRAATGAQGSRGAKEEHRVRSTSRASGMLLHCQAMQLILMRQPQTGERSHTRSLLSLPFSLCLRMRSDRFSSHFGTHFPSTHVVLSLHRTVMHLTSTGSSGSGLEPHTQRHLSDSQVEYPTHLGRGQLESRSQSEATWQRPEERQAP